MRDRAQELERVPFLLEWIRFGGCVADQLNAGGLNLGRLPLGWRGFHFAFNDDAGPGLPVLDLALVMGRLARRHDLHVTLAGAVVEFDEAEPALGIAASADPAPQLN